jgi:DNA-binding SARP family transcriptional activator
VTVWVRVLGPFEVVGPDGAAIDIGSRKQRAVLAILAVNANQPVSVDRLVADLWGDSPPDRAGATLQSYVSNLRRALEPDRPARTPPTVLLSRDPGYQLSLGPGRLDRDDFERLVDSARASAEASPEEARRLLSAALGLWRGGALADFADEPFAVPEIARLEELRISALESRLDADLALGRHRELIAELERLVGEHPLRERLWGLLMLALYRSGRQAEALRAYARCRTGLAEELGIDPSAELRRIEAAMLRQDPSLDAAAAPAPPGTPVRPEQPRPSAAGASGANGARLLGRDAEMAAFRAALDDAAHGCGRVVLVEGEPGIGKTRLLEAMDQEARAGAVPSCLARCVEVGGTPPFWPWTQIMRGLAAELGDDTIARSAGPHTRHLAAIVPELSPEPDPTVPRVPAELAPHRVAEAITASVRALTRDRPLVMLIDDLYSADPDSLSLLVLLAAEVERLGLVVVASYRTTEVPDDHPLADTLAQVTRMNRVSRFPLDRFAIADVGELVRRVSGVDVADDTIEAIHARTGGNAFFTVELTRLLANDGGFTPARVNETIPTTVRDVLRRRLAGLDGETVRLLRAAAVSGRRWDLDVAAEVAGLSVAVALDSIDAVVEAGLVCEDDEPGRYLFNHVLVGDAVAHALGALRRAQLHQEVAAALERRAERDPNRWIEIAHHAVEAVPVTGPGPALAPLARAGHHALRSNAYELAEQLLDRRLALTMTMPASPDRDPLEVAALLDLAVVWTWREGYHSNRLAEASRRILELADPAGTAAASGDVSSVLLPALQALYSEQIVSGRTDEAAQTARLLDELATADPDPLVVFSRHNFELVVAVHQGDVAEAQRRADGCAELLQVLDPGETGTVMLPLGQQVLAATVHAFTAWARWLAGDREAARRESALARAVTDRSGHGFTRAFAGTVEGLVSAMDGSPEWAADTLAWTTSGHDLDEYGLGTLWLTTISAWADGMRGEPAPAADRLREASGRLDEIGARVCMTQYRAMLAELELRAGRPAAALAATEDAIERTGRHGERYWYPELERLRAVALDALGRHGEAEEALDRAEKTARDMGIVPIVARIEDVRRSREPGLS